MRPDQRRKQGLPRLSRHRLFAIIDVDCDLAPRRKARRDGRQQDHQQHDNAGKNSGTGYDEKEHDLIP